jgi:murein DD-endopeptidase MepM/ murein hydrolase activator NlpD
MRLGALTLLALLLLAAPAAAQSTGGTLYAPTPRGFSVTPASVTAGAKVTFAFRAVGRVRARVDLLYPGHPTVRVRFGPGRKKLSWAAALPAGHYTARLVVTGRGAHAASAYSRLPLDVVAPPPPAGVFPVQGAYTLGDGFGVGRAGHSHQGQDIVAAAGTPVVSPVAGTVYWVAYQKGGAGYYVVVAGADGRHYAFMHFQEGSTAVVKGQAVTPGQRLGLVGATGDATGPHLHFEIWVDGWWATKASHPIDPLPDLEAWAGT